MQVPFFREDEVETTSAPKADAFFIPRENPRALIIQPIEKWPPRVSSKGQENGNLVRSVVNDNSS